MRRSRRSRSPPHPASHSRSNGRGCPRMIRRRDFLAGAAAVAAVSASPREADAQTEGWKAGAVQHLLPTVNGDRILLKASFHEARKDAPVLHVDDQQFVGERTDSEGSFWQFDADGLEPARNYTLVLADMRGRPLCDQWPVATFPALDDRPKQLRLLIFTCAGGHDGLGKHLPVATRVRLLKRGLSFKPQAVIANGDHVYWDLRCAQRTAMPRNTRIMLRSEKTYARW